MGVRSVPSFITPTYTFISKILKGIPDSIIFRNRFISVNIDGEAPKNRCNYCKETSYEIENCPKKKEKNKIKEIQNPTDQNTRKHTYAKAITSTPKTSQPHFLHPLTKMKLNKKPIEKNNENFPPLEPNNQIQNNEDIAPPKSITTSPNVSEEDVIESFDNIQLAKIPPLKSSNENSQAELTVLDDSKKSEKLPIICQLCQQNANVTLFFFVQVYMNQFYLSGMSPVRVAQCSI